MEKTNMFLKLIMPINAQFMGRINTILMQKIHYHLWGIKVSLSKKVYKTMLAESILFLSCEKTVTKERRVDKS